MDGWPQKLTAALSVRNQKPHILQLLGLEFGQETAETKKQIHSQIFTKGYSLLLTPPFLPAELRKELGSASDPGQSELCSLY